MGLDRFVGSDWKRPVVIKTLGYSHISRWESESEKKGRTFSASRDQIVGSHKLKLHLHCDPISICAHLRHLWMSSQLNPKIREIGLLLTD